MHFQGVATVTRKKFHGATGKTFVPVGDQVLLLQLKVGLGVMAMKG